MADHGHNHLAVGKAGALGLMSAQAGWESTWIDAHSQLDSSDKQSQQQKPEEVKLSVEFMDILQSSEPPAINSDYSDNVYVATLPIVGRVHVLQEKRSFLTVGFIIFYWVYGTWSTIYVLLRPRYNDGDVSEMPILFYSAVSVLCITSLFRAVTSNPGRIPFSKHEVPSKTDLPPDLYCQVCRRQRPERSHHCRRCGQCILRMDHHCPWINNCVGEANHYLFIQLLSYAFLMGITTLSICILHIYYWPPCVSCQKGDGFIAAHPTVFMLLTGGMAFWMFFFATVMLWCQYCNWITAFLHAGVLGNVVQTTTLIMAVCIMAGAGGLLLVHYTGAVRDMTTIDWMKLKIDIDKRKTFSYKDVPSIKKTLLEALDEMCGPGSRLAWPFPCRRRNSPLHISYPEVV